MNFGFFKSRATESIEVTFDKSHIVTIGEKLYAESVELIRELVNNAYDADAERVDVAVTDERISITDNGTGMDRMGLAQYFNVGSNFKTHANVSPKHRRQRIGQFGIGKFASLAACRRFIVETKRGDFAARVVFDKDEWERTPDHWRLPLEVLPPTGCEKDGTTVILENLTKTFDLEDVEDRIVVGVPLKAPNFKVFINGYPVLPRSYTGKRIPVLTGTEFGPIHGELVILPDSAASLDDVGIECKVKQVLIKRESFGMETWGNAIARVRGEVNADFLPITTDRTAFLVDAPEYGAFMHAMCAVMDEVKGQFGRLRDKKENKRAARALNEALERVNGAIFKNPDLSPFGAIPIGEPMKGAGGAAASKSRRDGKGEEPHVAEGEPSDGSDQVQTPELPKKLTARPQAIKKITPNAVVKKLKIGKYRISCCLDHYGDNKPECFTEGMVIYINRDHPLYTRESRSAATYTMYVARLLTQEISLMKEARSPRKAFSYQSRLLRDAFAHEAVKE